MSSILAEGPKAEASDVLAGPHAQSTNDLLANSQVDERSGLHDQAVADRRRVHGYNELDEVPPVPRWKKFLGHFSELVIVILIVAAVISGLLGEWSDALAILAIVVLNAVLGFLQEQKAEHALAALQKMSAPQAKVIRNGYLQVIPAQDLVPGDRIELEAGDKVPADARLIHASSLRVQEATLTGESLPVDKDSESVWADTTPLADRRNMTYMGTVVAAGKASAVVVATGMKTELGRIAGMLQQSEPELTPLQKRLAELGRVLAIACLIIVAIVFVVELLKGGKLLEAFLLSVSLAVAALPEGLPAVVTIALALGLQRMIRRNALIRRLPSVETLGSVTVICSDKTGTLTKNEMTVREIYAGGAHFEVSGAGYMPRGTFMKRAGANGSLVTASDEPDLAMALAIGVHCNNAKLQPDGTGANWQVIGDPTEGALLVVGMKAGIESTGREYRVLSEIPFDSERKAMSVVLRERTGRILMYTKGAPEVLLAKSVSELRHGKIESLSPQRRQEILDAGAAMASSALRVLAVAYREAPQSSGAYDELNLIFAGLVGMIDPPREEVKTAVKTCHQAGIRPIMITGDHPATALAIARELGIARDEDHVVTGHELNGLTDERLAARVEGISVYARVAPEHKLRIVRAWKSKGQIVAMTGDGVNDAPAVKAADIGIAMGLTGTDVTKEASAMVLTDDNFASIINAIEEGRGIYDNIQKFLHYLLAGNVGLILFVFVATLLLGWPFPLAVIQILWINLVTNGLPALALGVEPPEPDLMRRPPRPSQESVIPLQRGLRILLHGILVAAVTLIGFALAYQGDVANLPRARSSAFCLISYAFVLLSLSCRSERYTVFQLGFFSNPYLLGAVGISALLQLIITLPFVRSFFEASPHSAWEWVMLGILAFVPFTVVELTKWERQRFLRGEL
jgi:P-type Ca2+ transporter type 2C